MNKQEMHWYAHYRKEGYTADNAKHAAHVRALWEEHNENAVRLRWEPDELVAIEDLEGDMFDPEVNNDIPAEKLAQQRKEWVEMLDREGVWVLFGEYKCPHCDSWKVANSIGWLEGQNDYGYAIDIMTETLKQAGLWQD